MRSIYDGLVQAEKLDKANNLTHTILIEMQITRKQTSDESESSDSTLILNKRLSSRNNHITAQTAH